MNTTITSVGDITIRSRALPSKATTYCLIHFVPRWDYMEYKKPSVFVKNYDEGVKRVKKGNYAFLMESTMLDYVSTSLCSEDDPPPPRPGGPERL